jgi:hypothetical protein
MMIKEKTTQLSEIKKEISASSKTLTKMRQDKTTALRKRRIDLAELGTFRSCRRALDSAGLDFNDVEKTVNVISAIADADYNHEQIINEITKTRSLEDRKQSLQKDCDDAATFLSYIGTRDGSRHAPQHAY